MASWFKHIGGVLVLGVGLPDGSTATVPAASTGLRGLRALTTRLLESVQDRSAGADR